MTGLEVSSRRQLGASYLVPWTRSRPPGLRLTAPRGPWRSNLKKPVAVSFTR